MRLTRFVKFHDEETAREELDTIQKILQNEGSEIGEFLRNAIGYLKESTLQKLL